MPLTQFRAAVIIALLPGTVAAGAIGFGSRSAARGERPPAPAGRTGSTPAVVRDRDRSDLPSGKAPSVPPGGAAEVPAADAGPRKTMTRTVEVPEEEVGVWDPGAPDVTPVPWRVFGPGRPGAERPAAFRHAAVGKRVRVEGMGWGFDTAGVGPVNSRVVFDGGAVLVTGVDFGGAGLRGRCVRVVGTLRLEATDAGSMRRQPRCYRIDPESFEVLDRVTDPHVVLAPKP